MKDIATYKEKLQQVEAVWNRLSSKAIELEREVREIEQEKNRVAPLLELAKYRTLQAVLKRDHLGICFYDGELTQITVLSYIFYTYFWESHDHYYTSTGRDTYIYQCCRDHQPEIPNYLGYNSEYKDKIEITSEVVEREGRCVTRIRQLDVTDLAIVKRVCPKPVFEYFGIPPMDKNYDWHPYWTTIYQPENPQKPPSEWEIAQKLGLQRR